MSRQALLDHGLAVLGLDLPPAARQQLLAYAELLLKWNKVYNLTAIREPDQVITHHLLDSLAALPHLAGITTLADVGSGGGLPGIPLAIARPDLRVSSIETVNKKASFQQQARIELGLTNFEPRCARVEQVKPDQPFDAVISRAFSDLADFVAFTGHLIGPEGCLFAMKGVYPQEEIAALPAPWRVAEKVTLQVPGLDAQRHLLVLKRNP